MFGRLQRDERGFTLVEVMVAATVFMLGFSTLIAVANSSLAKFSTKEIELGSAIGLEAMRLAQARADATSFDTTFVRSGLSLRLIRQITVEGNLARVRIQVQRDKTNKLLADFYGEYALPNR